MQKAVSLRTSDTTSQARVLFEIQILPSQSFSLQKQNKENMMSCLVGIDQRGSYKFCKISQQDIIYFLQMQTTNPKIRKGISELTPAQKQQYFFLIRLLHILTPIKEDALPSYYQNYYIQNMNVGTPVIPKCLYDCLVTFHATSCEHRFEFFPYWHRWLTNKFEDYIWQASFNIVNGEFLDQEAQRIYNSMVPEQQKKTDKEKIRALLGEIKDDYLKIVADLKKQGADSDTKFIASHYWEFFNNQESIVNYPDGFISKEAYYSDRFKKTDELINIIWDQDSIYEINFVTRCNYKPNPDPNAPGRYNRFSKTKLDAYQKLLKNTQFWKNPEKHPDLIPLAEEFVADQDNSYFKHRHYQIRGKYVKDQGDDEVYQMLPQKIKHNVFDPMEVSYLFSSANFPCYKTNTKEEKKDPKIDPQDFKAKRNNSISLFTYCRSLHTKPEDFIGKFCTKINNSDNFSMETPHGQSHNYQQYMMMDVQRSITNPIFFAFHSTIDLMLEYRIRTFQEDKDKKKQAAAAKSVIDFLATKPNYFISRAIPEFRKGWAQYFIKHRDPKDKRQPLYEYYPILKWISPDWKKGDQVQKDTFCPVSKWNAYPEMILKQSSLKNLEELIDVKYNNLKESIFVKTVESTVAPDPTSKIRLYYAFELKLPSHLLHENILVQLSDSRGNVIYTVVSIFRRSGGQNGKCPNCPGNQTVTSTLPIEQFSPILQEFWSKHDKKGFDWLDWKIISEYSRELNEYLKKEIQITTSNPQVIGKMVTGRSKIKVIEDGKHHGKAGNVENQYKKQASIRFKVQESSQRKKADKIQSGHVGDSLVLIYNPRTGNYERQIEFLERSYNFVAVNGNSQTKSEIGEYVFPLYSDQTQVHVSNIPGEKPRVTEGPRLDKNPFQYIKMEELANWSTLSEQQALKQRRQIKKIWEEEYERSPPLFLGQKDLEK